MPLNPSRLRLITRIFLALLLTLSAMSAAVFWLLQRNPQALAEHYIEQLAASTGLSIKVESVNVALLPLPSLAVSNASVEGKGLSFTVAYATLEPRQRTEAAGLFSLVRNIGSSVGISVVMTMLSRSAQINHAEIGARIPAFGAETGLLPALWNPATTSGAALLNNEVLRQSAAIGYLNDFWLMMWLTVLAMPLVMLMRGGKASGGSAAQAAAAGH